MPSPRGAQLDFSTVSYIPPSDRMCDLLDVFRFILGLGDE